MSIALSPEMQRILEAGNRAPSGENCQPWRFVVHNETIEVHLLPDRGRSVYGWGQRASFLADGAAIENMVIAASAERYGARVDYFPRPSDPEHVATITLNHDALLSPDPLASVIEKRGTNRKAYETKPLSDNERSSMISAVEYADHVSLVLVDERNAMRTLGRVGSTNEEVMLANRSLHEFFFTHVNWTRREDEHKRVGFYIKTLELPPPAELVFKLIRHWGVMRIGNAVFFNRLIAAQNAATNASASAIGVILIPEITPIAFVQAGRTVERLWLTATALGLSFQPLAGIPFLRLQVHSGDTDLLTDNDARLINRAYERAAALSGAGDRHIAFMFRIGHSDPPSARSVRFSLDEVVTVVS